MFEFLWHAMTTTGLPTAIGFAGFVALIWWVIAKSEEDND